MSFLNAKEQLKEFLTDTFFETGTYEGRTSRDAKDIGFKRVITTELQERLYQESIQMSKGYDIEFHLGDSPELMRKILPTVEGKITFWLDAHIDGGNYIPGVTPDVRQCPLYEELEVLKTLDRKDHNILIDDMRIIGTIGWGVGTVKEILIQKILEINPSYQISFLEGEGNHPNDILVATIK
jgi:hypothetical protein